MLSKSRAPSPAKLLAMEKRTCRWRGEVKAAMSPEIVEEPGKTSSAMNSGTTDCKVARTELLAVHVPDNVWKILEVSTDMHCFRLSIRAIGLSRYIFSGSGPPNIGSIPVWTNDDAGPARA